MSINWKEDPRLKQMNPAKVEILMEFSRDMENTPKPQIMEKFMMLNAKASASGIQFSPQETELLVAIFTSGMNAGEKKKLESLRLLAEKLSKRSNS